MAEKIGIDEIDCKIMDLIQKEPSLTHTQIAEHVNRSQPTVGMRIKKLENLGVLKYQAGINIKVADLYFARAEIQAKNPKKIFNIVKNCPFMLTAFRLSGDTNISILIAGLSLKDLDHVVNHHLRGNPEIFNVHMDIIEDVADDFVLPIDLNFDYSKINLENSCCGKCEN
ncbi:MAG: Lrp/AsnC family transcriptional regulator [Candidatus Heimdallarchaeota archaeon]